MRAVVYNAREDVAITDVPEPKAGDGQVLVKVGYNGICGTDLHEYYAGPIFIPTEPHPLTGRAAPLILGHELAGTVVEVGPGVKSLSEGDRIAVEPLYVCGECVPCRAGRYNICTRIGFHGLSTDGGMAEYTVVNESMAHKLPDEVSTELGALVEPMSVAYHAAKLGDVDPDGTALVFGGGPIGIGLWFALRGHRCGAAALALFLLSCLTASVCQAQTHDVVCRAGDGEFQAEFRTGVKVHVGAARNEGLAARVCEASLSWSDQTLVVAAEASDADIDAFGVDLGVGAPVAALQVKKSKAECCMEYKIYSLRAPPVLLRSIKGGTFFSAADTDLDGRVEIWTDDAAAVDGFESIPLRDLDFAPPVVLRFERGRLLDAGSAFPTYYDQKIADERAKLTPQDLSDFKGSDGRLALADSVPAARLSRLKSVKMRVLEIVWSYLYSGREKEAWRSLSEMWPATDVERIRAALLSARARGIRSQVDGLAIVIHRGHENHAKIYDGTTTVTATPGLTPKEVKPKQEITPPRAILMERQPPVTAIELELAKSESLLKLVIDAAGKVRSVEVMGNAQQVDEGLVKSTSNWKFIPAFNAGQPVASRIFLGVSLRK